MTVQQDHIKYGQYNPQGLMRTSFGMFTDAGMNLFPSGPNQNPSDFLDLTNVLPSTSGGFRRRWGLSTMFQDTSGAFTAVRSFFYNVTANTGALPPTTQADLIISTDNQHFRVVSVTSTAAPSPLTNTLTFSAFSGHGPSNFSSSGNVGAVTSRDWFYYCNGINTPRKVCPADASSNTDSNWGIVAPFLYNGVTPTITAFGGTGTGYTGTPTVTITGGGGSGATATAVVNANGAITSFTVTNPGTGYTSTPTVTISGTGTGAAAIGVFNNFGAVSAVLPAGPIQLNSGRTYTYAWQSSVTGHTSDIANGISSGGSRLPLQGGVVTVQGPGVGVIGNVPPGPGFTDIYLTISPVGGVDTQVDTLILLATADGGTLQQLYEVATEAVTAPNPTTINYTDTTPDSYSDNYITGLTLLNANTYISTDGSGNNFGISNNTPPPAVLLYPTVHQGRMFGTDGLNLFFSKSLTEVTSSTGLITSKWEESWPGTNVIPIGLDNEYIVGLRSSGQVLHIATSKAIYELQGSDPSTFAIPDQLFSETGILTQDLWTVVYAQGKPTGAAFVTPDLKMVYSDYNTYQDVSVPIYPLMKEWASAYTTHAKLTSFAYGPYNFVALCMSIITTGGAFYMLFETTLQKWFRWEVTGNTTGPLNSFVYQHPETGYRGLFFMETSGANTFYRLFDPTLTTDYGGTVIPWSIQTSWTSLSDPLAFKTINEIELISDETDALTVELYGTSTQAGFDSGTQPTSPSFIGFKQAVTSPLGTLKTYWAGLPTNSRYFSISIFTNGSGTVSSSSIEVLTHFIVEHFPMVRF